MKYTLTIIAVLGVAVCATGCERGKPGNGNLVTEGSPETPFTLNDTVRQEIFEKGIKQSIKSEYGSSRPETVKDEISESSPEEVGIEKLSGEITRSSLPENKTEPYPQYTAENKGASSEWLEEVMLLRSPPETPKTVRFTSATIEKARQEGYLPPSPKSIAEESIDPSPDDGDRKVWLTEEEKIEQEIEVVDVNSGIGIALSETLLAKSEGITTDEIIVGHDAEGREIRAKDINVAVQGQEHFSEQSGARFQDAQKALPPSLKRAGPLVDFGPHGATFEEPIYIKIPYDEKSLEEAGVSTPYELKIFYFDDKKQIWTDEGIKIRKVDTQAKIIYAEVQHF